MAKRVALIPEELISSYQLQKPELRLEDEIAALLERANIADDLKVKLLGDLIMRYHKSVHTPKEPIRVSMADETETIAKTDEQPEQTFKDKILEGIMSTIPKLRKKYVTLIVEKLKTREYYWNERGEFTQKNQPIAGSSVIDFFHYLMTSSKNALLPRHFFHFLKAIKEVNIPLSWIANKSLVSHLKAMPRIQTASDSEESEESSVFRSSVKRDLNLKRREARFKTHQRSRFSSKKTPEKIGKWQSI